MARRVLIRAPGRIACEDAGPGAGPRTLGHPVRSYLVWREELHGLSGCDRESVRHVKPDMREAAFNLGGIRRSLPGTMLDALVRSQQWSGAGPHRHVPSKVPAPARTGVGRLMDICGRRRAVAVWPARVGLAGGSWLGVAGSWTVRR